MEEEAGIGFVFGGGAAMVTGDSEGSVFEIGFDKFGNGALPINRGIGPDGDVVGIVYLWMTEDFDFAGEASIV